MNVYEEPVQFPPVVRATEEGLLMIGGKLAPNWVIAAYGQGIFPWPIVDHGYEILAWFSPDPRAVLELDQLYVSRRLARRIRRGRFQVTSDRDFAGVVAGCAAPREPFGETWITADMIRVYNELHQRGHAHSVEVWRAGTLVGGVYGVSIGAFFAGESMFYRERDASKVALVFLVAHLKARGFQLFDVQQATSHVLRLGASEITRDHFLARLHHAVNAPVDFGHGLDTSRLDSMLQRS
ncbi:MAG: leucyl/phenylalanyl-tRNA--protein transferase [Planctomycetota bacterium]